MDKQQLIDCLNDDLAGELQAIIQYMTYSAVVAGPYRPQLVTFMQAEIQDELRHAHDDPAPGSGSQRPQSDAGGDPCRRGAGDCRLHRAGRDG